MYIYCEWHSLIHPCGNKKQNNTHWLANVVTRMVQKKKRKRKRQSNNRRNVSWMNDRDERESWPLAPSRVNGLVFNPIKCQVECQLAADENQSILSGRFVSFYCQPGRDKQNEIGLSTSREKNSRRKTFQRERKERHIFRRKKNSGIHK